MVRRRHVYHMAGYDPIDPGAQHRRFARQLDVFQRTWNVETSVSELAQDSEQSRAWWTVRARGPNWQVETVHEILLWDDIVRADFRRPLPVRLFVAVRAYLDFIITGTMFRYIVANQRYAIFFLFPILSVVLFAAVGWFFARLLTGFLGLDGFAAAALGVPTGLVLFLVLMRWPGRRWRVDQRLDLRPRLHSRQSPRHRRATRSFCADLASAGAGGRTGRDRPRRPQPRRDARARCDRSRTRPRRQFRPPRRRRFCAHHRRDDSEIRAAPARARDPRQNCPHCRRAIDRLDRIPISR